MALLAEGANVSYCARNVTNEEFSSVETAAGAKAVGTKVDISDPEAIKAWVEKSKATFGRIDHVIANGEHGDRCLPRSTSLILCSDPQFRGSRLGFLEEEF
jgi:NAD(P)-dependent dehydrogenase (short-subunit alcohol dehydrogenase family)